MVLICPGVPLRFNNNRKGADVGRRGPQPKPAAIRLLNGRSPGRDSGGRKVPTPRKVVGEPPEPPDYFDTFELAEWERIVDELEPFGLLRQVSHSTMEIACQATSLRLRAYATYRKEGMVCENPQSGHKGLHPAVRAFEIASKLYFAAARELGVTPSSEQQLGAIVDGDDDRHNPFNWG